MQLIFLKVGTWLNDAFKLLALTVSDERVGEVEVAHHADLGILGPGLNLSLDGDEVVIRVMLVVNSLLQWGKKHGPLNPSTIQGLQIKHNQIS